MLRRRLGLLRVAPFEAVFQKIYEASWIQLKGHSFAPPLHLPFTRGQPFKTAAPPRLINSAYMLSQVREAHKLVTGTSTCFVSVPGVSSSMEPYSFVSIETLYLSACRGQVRRGSRCISKGPHYPCTSSGGKSRRGATGEQYSI